MNHHVMFDLDGTLIQSYCFDEACFVAAVRTVLNHDVDTHWAGYQHVTDSGILKEHLARHPFVDGWQSILSNVQAVFIENVQRYLALQPAEEVLGATALLDALRERTEVSVSIATGGWRETALMKLASAGIDITDIPLASSNDHYAREEIMKIAGRLAGIDASSEVTYLGDGAWDKRACEALGYNFILVGDRISHGKCVSNFSNIERVLMLAGID